MIYKLCSICYVLSLSHSLFENGSGMNVITNGNISHLSRKIQLVRLHVSVRARVCMNLLAFVTMCAHFSPTYKVVTRCMNNTWSRSDLPSSSPNALANDVLDFFFFKKLIATDKAPNKCILCAKKVRRMPTAMEEYCQCECRRMSLHSFFVPSPPSLLPHSDSYESHHIIVNDRKSSKFPFNIWDFSYLDPLNTNFH